MSDAQQMIALVIFAWIGLACVLGSAAVAVYSLMQWAVFEARQYRLKRRRV